MGSSSDACKSCGEKEVSSAASSSLSLSLLGNLRRRGRAFAWRSAGDGEERRPLFKPSGESVPLWREWAWLRQ